MQKKPLRASELILFARSLQGLLDGGVPILRALEGLRKEMKGRKDFYQMISEVLESIRRGSSLSASLERSGRVPVFFCQSVYAGEVSGRVPAILGELVKYLEREEGLKRAAQRAVIYPAFIAVVGVVTLGVLSCYVLPKLRVVYEEFGTELPLLTRIILGASGAFVPLVVIGVIGGAVMARRFAKDGRMAAWVYRAPVVGKYSRGFARVRLSRLLSLLLESGISAYECMLVAEKTFANHYLKSDMRRFKEFIASGKGFGVCVEKVEWMDGMSRLLVASGEETGRVAESFGQIARDTEMWLESRIEVLMKLLEPGLVLVVGLIVGIVVIGTVLPIFDMSGLVQ